MGKKLFRAAVIGSGPAGLMAAYTLASQGVRVSLFEKRKGLGRKLLIAGSSGLNITYDSPAAEFHKTYTACSGHFERVLKEFPPEAWIRFIEKDLGIPTFKGTSRRYFVEGMKASSLLKTWAMKLKELKVEILTEHEWSDIEVSEASSIRLSFSGGKDYEFDAVCLALGGGSYEPTENPLRWPEILKKKGMEFKEFKSANAGFEVDWPPGLLEEAEGKPIKNVVLHSKRGTRSGEIVITRYGVEGTPVYFAGVSGLVHLDLKPSLDHRALLAKLSAGKENLSPIRRIKKFSGLSEGALALVFHLMPQESREDLKRAVDCMKSFPLFLKKPRPLAEAISSSGGLAWDEVDENLMLKKLPGVYAAGEMLDWDAPTGGFLIQGSVSEGYFVGKRILEFASRNRT